MKSHLPRSRPTEVTTDRGVALVLTLLIISMLVVVVVGFVSVSRLEQMAARNYTHQAAAEQMAQLATGQAMERLSRAMQEATNSPMFSTQPGQINIFGAPPELLYSTGAITNNVNRLMTNGLITGDFVDNVNVGVQTVNDASNKPVGRVAFYIDDESTKIPVNQATGATNNRTLNPQWPRPFAIQGAVGVNAARASDFNAILINTINNLNNPASISNWSYFFTPEQLRAPLTAAPLHQLTVAVETNPATMDTTPWGSPKIRINQASLTVQQLAQALSSPSLAQVFGQTFADKYTPDGLNQLAANLLQLRSAYWSTNYILGAGTNSFEQGTILLNQPVLGTNALGGQVATLPTDGMLKKTNGIPTEYLGYIPFPMLAEVSVGGIEYGFSAPSTVNPNMTIRFFIACKLYNPFPKNYAGGGQLYVQVDKARLRLTNSNAVTLSTNAAAQVWRGPDGTHRLQTPGYNDEPTGAGGGNWDPWGGAGNQDRPEPNADPANTNAPPPLIRGLTPASGIVTVPLPQINAGAATNLLVHFDIATTANDQSTGMHTNEFMYVIVDQIKLLATNDPTAIRDWCSGPDMRQAFGQPQTAQFQIPTGNVGGARGDFTNGTYVPSQSASPTTNGWVTLVKKDPRMKASLNTVTSNPAWQTNNGAGPGVLALNPSDFTNNTIPPDVGSAIVAIYNTNLPPILSVPPPTTASSGHYAIAADLGKVFTGVPWRTLRMQPQPVLEANDGMIPDWVLLDAVSFGDGTRALNSANPNSQILSLTDPVMRRTAAIRSQLDVLTNSATNVSLRSIAHPISSEASNSTLLLSVAAATSFPTNIRVTDAAVIAGVAANAQRPDLTASWATNSSWPARRAQLGFPSNSLMLPSEMAEIRAVADFIPAASANPNKFNEYRLSTLFPGSGARSRFFRIYAVGEALEGPATNPTVAGTALLQTLVEVRTNSTPPSVHIINQYPPAD
jgi:Tfp pilus assembly protein PilX